MYIQHIQYIFDVLRRRAIKAAKKEARKEKRAAKDSGSTDKKSKSSSTTQLSSAGTGLSFLIFSRFSFIHKKYAD